MSNPELPDPLIGKARKHKEAKERSLNKGIGKTSIIPKTEYEPETEFIALERFPVFQLKKLGAGSDRIVYDLEDGNVLKIAKNARGLLQNSYESPDYVLGDLVPEVREKGLDYVVSEKVTIDYKKGKKLLSPLQPLTFRDLETHSSQLQEAFHQLGIEDLLNYDILFNDIKRYKNWGFRGNKLVLLDQASTSKEILDKDAKKQFISDWKIVLSRRRKVLNTMNK